VCNHCTDADDAECNYTPKKRHKVPSDHGPVRDRQVVSYGHRSASFLVSDMSVLDDQTANGDSSEGHSFYGQNVASSSHFAASPSPFEREESSDFDDSRYATSSGRYMPDYQGRSGASHSSQPSSVAPNPPQPTKSLSFISHSFPGDQGVLISRSNVDPWSHPAFAPLPEIVLHRLSTVNCVEMPNRHSFDESLSTFLAQLMPEIRETATFVPDIYAKICRYIARGDTSKLPERLRLWTSFHHVRLGSDRYSLLLKPRDAFFDIGPVEEEKLRRDYVMHIDGKASMPSEAHASNQSYAKDSAEHGLDPLEWATAFERLPVQPQIYDVLVYAHRAHGTASSMLFEVRRLGVVSNFLAHTNILTSYTAGLYYLADGRYICSPMPALQFTRKANEFASCQIGNAFRFRICHETVVAPNDCMTPAVLCGVSIWAFVHIPAKAK
jgi:hypothetical protein